MRNSGYPLVLEAMRAEAAATVREAGSLASRLGHAAVTPLHVASAILSSSSSTSTQAADGLLRGLSGHQFRHEHLKVSLDEALARIPPVACPVGAARPLHLSNALVAVLRRATTIPSQRRSSSGRVRRLRRQRQQVAAAKIELQQLVTSMLDDPSVHRAMRKAADVVDHSNLARAALQPSSGLLDRPVATNITCLSGSGASQGKPREVLPSFVVQSGVTIERASRLPSWLHRHQDAILESQRTTIQPTCFRQQMFAQLSAINFKIMCQALELHVTHHQDIIPDIASTVLLCRSGLMRRTSSLTCSTTWLIFLGKDFYGKKAMAEELSKLIFGSYTKFSLVKVVDSSSDTTNLALKRKRYSQHGDKVYLIRKLFQAIQENPHRVVFIDGVNQLDYESETTIKNLIATGRIMGPNGRDMLILEDTIFVLSSDEASCSRRTSAMYQKMVDRQNRKEDVMKEKEEGSRPCSLDLNVSVEDNMEDEEDNIIANNVGIMSVVDGVFRFD